MPVITGIDLGSSMTVDDILAKQHKEVNPVGATSDSNNGVMLESREDDINSTNTTEPLPDETSVAPEQLPLEQNVLRISLDSSSLSCSPSFLNKRLEPPIVFNVDYPLASLEFVSTSHPMQPDVCPCDFHIQEEKINTRFFRNPPRNLLVYHLSPVMIKVIYGGMLHEMDLLPTKIATKSKNLSETFLPPALCSICSFYNIQFDDDGISTQVYLHGAFSPPTHWVCEHAETVAGDICKTCQLLFDALKDRSPSNRFFIYPKYTTSVVATGGIVVSAFQQQPRIVYNHSGCHEVLGDPKSVAYERQVILFDIRLMENLFEPLLRAQCSVEDRDNACSQLHTQVADVGREDELSQYTSGSDIDDDVMESPIQEHTGLRKRPPVNTNCRMIDGYLFRPTFEEGLCLNGFSSGYASPFKEYYAPKFALPRVSPILFQLYHQNTELPIHRKETPLDEMSAYPSSWLAEAVRHLVHRAFQAPPDNNSNNEEKEGQQQPDHESQRLDSSAASDQRNHLLLRQRTQRMDQQCFHFIQKCLSLQKEVKAYHQALANEINRPNLSSLRPSPSKTPEEPLSTRNRYFNTHLDRKCFFHDNYPMDITQMSINEDRTTVMVFSRGGLKQWTGSVCPEFDPSTLRTPDDERSPFEQQMLSLAEEMSQLLWESVRALLERMYWTQYESRSILLILLRSAQRDSKEQQCAALLANCPLLQQLRPLLLAVQMLRELTPGAIVATLRLLLLLFVNRETTLSNGIYRTGTPLPWPEPVVFTTFHRMIYGNQSDCGLYALENVKLRAQKHMEHLAAYLVHLVSQGEAAFDDTFHHHHGGDEDVFAPSRCLKFSTSRPPLSSIALQNRDYHQLDKVLLALVDSANRRRHLCSEGRTVGLLDMASRGAMKIGVQLRPFYFGLPLFGLHHCQQVESLHTFHSPLLAAAFSLRVLDSPWRALFYALSIPLLLSSHQEAFVVSDADATWLQYFDHSMPTGINASHRKMWLAFNSVLATAKELLLFPVEHISSRPQQPEKMGEKESGHEEAKSNEKEHDPQEPFTQWTLIAPHEIINESASPTGDDVSSLLPERDLGNDETPRSENGEYSSTNSTLIEAEEDQENGWVDVDSSHLSPTGDDSVREQPESGDDFVVVSVMQHQENKEDSPVTGDDRNGDASASISTTDYSLSLLLDADNPPLFSGERQIANATLETSSHLASLEGNPSQDDSSSLPKREPEKTILAQEQAQQPASFSANAMEPGDAAKTSALRKSIDALDEEALSALRWRFVAFLSAYEKTLLPLFLEFQLQTLHVESTRASTLAYLLPSLNYTVMSIELMKDALLQAPSVIFRGFLELVMIVHSGQRENDDLCHRNLAALMPDLCTAMYLLQHPNSGLPVAMQDFLKMRCVDVEPLRKTSLLTLAKDEKHRDNGKYVADYYASDPFKTNYRHIRDTTHQVMDTLAQQIHAMFTDFLVTCP